MSQPITTAQPAFEMPKMDCETNRDSMYWGSFDYTSSSSNTAGFDCSKMGSISGRAKPRLKRMSREQMGAYRSVLNSAKIDLGLNGFDRELKADGELRNVFGGGDENLGSTESERNADIDGKLKQFESSGNVTTYLDGRLKQFESSGNVTSYFSSSLISSTSNSISKDGDFHFASDRSSSNLDASLKNGTFVFCARKAGCPTVKVDESPKVDVFGSDKDDSTSCVKLDQHNVEKNGSQQSADEFGKAKSACGNGSVKCNFGFQSHNPGKLLDNDAIDKEVGNAVPDVMAEIELASYGDSEKVSPFCVRLSSNSVDGIGNENINYMFGSYGDSKISIDLEKNPTCNNGSSDIKDGGIENTIFDAQFQNGCPDGVFTFGGLRGREVFSSDGSTKLVHEMNQLSKEKAEVSKRSVERDYKTGSCRNGESTSDCNTEGAFVEGHIFNLTNEMKRMNIDSSGADADKTAKFTSNMCASVNNVFVFGSNQKTHGSMNENHLKNLSEKTPDKSQLSHDNPQLNRTSSLFSSVEIESCQSGEFFDVPTMNKDENDGINFTSKLAGLDSSDISDCTLAAASDPNFFKVILRAGTCCLILGEVEDAINCYNKCLESRTYVCLDRRVTIEAADCLQRAKRVSILMHESDKLLKEESDDAVNSALEGIAEALSISMHSEKLLEMKGRALCFLRMHHELTKLCNKQILDIAEKNFTSAHLDDQSCKSSYGRLWRWYLQTKSHYHLGRLDVALDLIEQVEKLSITTKSGDITQESVSTLASSIRELLHLKKSGNDAFQSGRFTEAVEHYTVAISKSVDSRPFMAFCFCNRAAAYQSIGQIIDAIADYSVAIALDENYHKAIFRRATLHETIRDYKQATYDLLKMISLLESRLQQKTQQSGPQNRSGGSNRKDLRKARRLFSKLEAQAKKDIPLNFYLILEIKASDTESEIKKAYRKAALRHHPDKALQCLIKSDVGYNGMLWKDVGEKIHSDADKLFKIIGEAYTVLSDSSKRAKYENEEMIWNVSMNSNNRSNSGCPSTSYSRH